MNTAETVTAAPPPIAVRSTTCFSVHGAADPGLLPRVAGLWAKRGLMPARWHSAVCGADDGELYIDIEVASLTQDAAGRIAGELRQIWGVSQVLVSLDPEPIST